MRLTENSLWDSAFSKEEDVIVAEFKGTASEILEYVVVKKEEELGGLKVDKTLGFMKCIPGYCERRLLVLSQIF